MKKDFRIGNWVLIPEGNAKVFIPCIPIQIDAIEFKGARYKFDINYKNEPLRWGVQHVIPIELKSEHLKGTGFVLQPWGYVKDKFLMTKEFLFRVGNGFDKQIKYVHELQNLYFALTGNELKIDCSF